MPCVWSKHPLREGDIVLSAIPLCLPPVREAVWRELQLNAEVRSLLGHVPADQPARWLSSLIGQTQTQDPHCHALCSSIDSLRRARTDVHVRAREYTKASERDYGVWE